MRTLLEMLKFLNKSDIPCQCWHRNKSYIDFYDDYGRIILSLSPTCVAEYKDSKVDKLIYEILDIKPEHCTVEQDDELKYLTITDSTVLLEYTMIMS